MTLQLIFFHLFSFTLCADSSGSVKNRFLSYIFDTKAYGEILCYNVISLPLFRYHCVGVDTVGHLNVKLDFKGKLVNQCLPVIRKLVWYYVLPCWSLRLGKMRLFVVWLDTFFIVEKDKQVWTAIWCIYCFFFCSNRNSCIYLFIYSFWRNNIFQYFSGVSIGVFGSLLLVFIIIFRYIPHVCNQFMLAKPINHRHKTNIFFCVFSKKKTAILALFGGSSFIFLSTKWIFYHFKSMTNQFQFYIIGYVLASAFISWIYMVCMRQIVFFFYFLLQNFLLFKYYRGPINNERTLNIIEYTLKLISVYMIYVSTSFVEMTLLVLLSISAFKMIFKLAIRALPYIRVLM